MRLPPWPVALLLALVGCEGAEERCRRIEREDWMHPLRTEARDQYDRQDSATNLADAIELRQRMDSINRSMGMDPDELRRMVGDTGPVTAPRPDVPPPPRPSDLAWYRENCFEGRAR